MPLHLQTPSSLASFKSRLVSCTGLPRLSWKRGRQTGILPCELSTLKNLHTPGVSAAKCRVKISHSKNWFKIYVWWHKQYLIPYQKDVHIGYIKNRMTNEPARRNRAVDEAWQSLVHGRRSSLSRSERPLNWYTFWPPIFRSEIF